MSNTGKQFDELLPLPTATFQILLALADKERHGYAIMQEIAIQTNNRVHMGPGTLYGSIKRLLAEGLIEETGYHPDTLLNDERRRYYRLTDLGHRLTVREAQRLEDLVKIAREKKLLNGPLLPERGVIS